MATAPAVCPVCEVSPLVGSTEVLQGFCVKCGPRLLVDISAARDEILSVRTHFGNLMDELNVLKEVVLNRAKFLDAENRGKEAAKRQLSDSENPFPVGSSERVFWDYGWIHEASVVKLSEIRAVMGWTLELLGHVTEIAKGYGQEEISKKLETIVERIGPHVADIGE